MKMNYKNKNKYFRKRKINCYYKENSLRGQLNKELSNKNSSKKSLNMFNSNFNKWNLKTSKKKKLIYNRWKEWNSP